MTRRGRRTFVNGFVATPPIGAGGALELIG